MRKLFSFPLMVGVVALVALLLVPQTASASAGCPTGFACSLEFDGDPSGSTPLVEPTDMKIGPDDIIYVVTQDGAIRLVDPSLPANDRLLPDPLIDISSRVDSNAEHGMLGLELHPDFDGTNGYFFVYYTVENSNPSTDSFHRISRFELVNGNVDATPYDATTNPDGELILFETEIIDEKDWHHGGMLRWGPDDTLYIAVGDSLFPEEAPLLTSSFGKILRINLDGTVPSDNPFLTQTSGKYDAIWAKGLRHPYNIAFSSVWDVMYINEVGQSNWEEINTGIPGADYGWSDTNIDGEQETPGLTDPTYAYEHTTGCSAITGGVFYEPAVASFPAEYYGKYFFTDYCFDWIDIYDPDTETVERFSQGEAERLLRLEVDSEGNLWALKRLRNTGSGGTIVNQPASLYKFEASDPFAPEITINPTDQTTVESSSATFICAAAANPTPTYQWQQSTDGGATWSNVPSGGTTNTYTRSNVSLSDDGLQVRCVVTNTEGSTNSEAAALTVIENGLPVPAITTPTPSLTYSGGDVVNFSGSATDTEDGPLTGADLEWTVDHHHGGVVKPVTNIAGVSSESFTIDGDGGITTPDQFFRITLTATDSLGFSQSTFVDIQPNLIDVTLTTDPEGLNVNFEAVSVADGTTLPRVAGFDYGLGAPLVQQSNGEYYVFESWSQGGDRNQSVSLPETDVTYTATFSTDKELGATYNAPNHEVDLSWTDGSSTETGFTVQRQKEGTTEWITVGTVGDNTESYTDDTVTCDQTYVYRVNTNSTGGDLNAVVSQTVTTNCDTFADVPSDLPAPFMEPWVEDFYNAGITQGCAENPLAYCPDEPVTRGAMAVFLIRAMQYPDLPHTPQGDTSDPFADVPSDLPAPFMEDWVEEFLDLGITQGCAEDPLRFCPNEPVTRGAMAVFILRALEGGDYTPQGNDSDTFADVPSDLPAPFMEDWVEDFYTRGITQGCGTDGNGDLIFCPNEPVTRGAMAVFMLRAFDDIPGPNDP